MIIDTPDAPAKLDAYRAALAQDTPEAVLRGTADYFSAACDAQVVPPLAIDPADLDDAPNDPEVRIRAVRDRLRRLGYDLPLLPDPAEGLWTQDLKDCLGRFVAEAGIPAPDETAGELTVVEWDALQQLFSFESPLLLADWFDGDAPCVPLRRAVRLRLSVLGFGPAPRPGDFEPAPADLASFADLALRLGVSATPLPTAITPSLVSTLFEHDDLVERLALCAPLLAALSDSLRRDAETFLLCAAKIELWLFGYDVVPDGTTDLVLRTQVGPRDSFIDKPNDTAAAISTFWNETQPPAPDDSPLRAASLSPAAIPAEIPALLGRMAALRRENEATLPRANASDLLVTELEAQLAARPSLWAEIKAAAGRMVSALFDGIRRVFSWVRNLLAKAWDAATTATYNLWRAVYHFMGGAAFNLRRAFAAMNDGVSYALHPASVSAPAGCSALARRFDGDSFLLVDPSAAPSEVVGFTRALEHGALAFAIACRIFRIATIAIRSALTGVGATLGGFVPVILGLASIYSQVRILIVQLDALSAFDATTVGLIAG